MSNIDFQGMSDLLWSSYASLQVGEAMGDSEWAPWLLMGLGVGMSYLRDYMNDRRAYNDLTIGIKGNKSDNVRLKKLLNKSDPNNSPRLDSLEEFEDVKVNAWDQTHQSNPNDLSPITNPSLKLLTTRNEAGLNNILSLQTVLTAFSDTAPITQKLEALWKLEHPGQTPIDVNSTPKLEVETPTFQDLQLLNNTKTTLNGSPSTGFFSKLNIMSGAGGAVAGAVAGMGALKLGSAVFGDSKGGQFATGVLSLGVGTAAGSIGSTVGSNLAKGAGAFSGAGGNLTSAFSNTAGLTSLGAGVANIALDVFDPVKKSKAENWINAGLGVASLATPWTAVGALAFNAAGHLFGGKTLSFTADRDMLALGGSSYGGTTGDILEAESLANTKYSLYNRGNMHKDDSKIFEAKRLANTMENIVYGNQIKQDATAGTSGINNYRTGFEMLGGYDLRYSLRAKNGAKLDIVRAREILSAKKSISTISKFQQGGTLNNTPQFNELEAREYIYNRFPILKNISFELDNDNTFNPNEDINDGHKYGNIEYWLSQHDTLPYYNNRQKPEKYKGKSVIIFNNKATYEDMALDALSHGLREQDPKYQALFEELMNDPDFKYIAEDLVLKDNYPNPDDWRKLSKDELQEFLNNFRLSEDYAPSIDGLVRAMLVKPEERESRGYGYSDEEFTKMANSPAWRKLLAYINGEVEKHQEGGIIGLINPSDIIEDDIEEFKEGGIIEHITYIEFVNPESISDEDDVEKFQNGGSVNIIPEGALHAHKHHMEDAENLTKKGIPVVDNDNKLQAEIEREEIIFRLEVTSKLEELLKQYDSKESSLSDKDKAALEAGKLLVEEILHNTIDNTNNLL